MRILLIGGTGHTGERVARRLRQAGHDVRVLSRKPASNPIVAGLLKWDVEIAEGDCDRAELLRRAMERCDAVVSCSHVKYARRIVEACEQTGLRRYIQMSSARRFSNLLHDPTVLQVREAEAVIEASDLDYTIVRPTMIFGGCRDSNLTRLVEYFRRRRMMPVFGGGENLVQPIYVEDLVDLMMAVLHHPEKSTRRAINAGCAEAISYREFLTETCRAATGKDPIMVRLPIGLSQFVLSLAPSGLKKRGISPLYIQRMGEDRSISNEDALSLEEFRPRIFAEGIRLKCAGEAEVEKRYGKG